MKGILIGLILVVVAALGGFWWWSQQILPVDAASQAKLAFVVSRDQTASQIIQSLSGAGLIRSPLVARIYLKISGQERKLQAGSFVLSPDMTLAQVYQVLTGPPADVWVTIPEGWRREQIAARLQATFGQTNQDFVATDFLKATATLEGQLFPDTYLIPISATAERVIQIMTANFAAKAKLSLPADSQTLIVASLVEREALSDTDRPVIAGILWKRLQAGWPLQVDAAVQYGRDSAICKAALLDCDYWKPLTDTKFASPFNTYLHSGLPPAPIANPGLSAISAAASPQTSPYWFYIHTPEGAVYYGRTVEEHNANIDKYLLP